MFKSAVNKNDIPILCDIHTHILPGVDDGARSMDMSMSMIDIAYDDGVRQIAATPHWHPVKCTYDHSRLLDVFDDFTRRVEDRYPDMKLSLGREIYYNSDIIEELENGGLYTYENTHYVLVEFSINEDYRYIFDAVNRIIQAGFTPVLAHVERYMSITENEDRVKQLRRLGVVIQSNASAILGEQGRGIKIFLLRCLKNNWIDIVASDAHSNGHRAPRLSECYEYVRRKTDAGYAGRIFSEAPKLIVSGGNL